jgi:hypothetical protein
MIRENQAYGDDRKSSRHSVYVLDVKLAVSELNDLCFGVKNVLT